MPLIKEKPYLDTSGPGEIEFSLMQLDSAYLNTLLRCFETDKEQLEKRISLLAQTIYQKPNDDSLLKSFTFLKAEKIKIEHLIKITNHKNENEGQKRN